MPIVLKGTTFYLSPWAGEHTDTLISKQPTLNILSDLSTIPENLKNTKRGVR